LALLAIDIPASVVFVVLHGWASVATPYCD
jgi:hypothetical protein